MAYWAMEAQPGGEDDLENVGADGGRRGHAEGVDEHGEGDEPAAHAHDGRQDADDHAAHGNEHAGDLLAALDIVLVKGDHGRDVHLLELHCAVGRAGGAAVRVAARS